MLSQDQEAANVSNGQLQLLRRLKGEYSFSFSGTKGGSIEGKVTIDDGDALS